MKCCGPTLSLVTIIISIVVCVIGIVLMSYLPGVIQTAIAKNLVLSTTSANYDSWVQPPVALYTKYYLFNYTNDREFVSSWKNGTKPMVQQIGPYVYRQFRRKENITFIDDDEVEFYMRKESQFVPEMSNGTEEDRIIFPNMVLRTIAHNEKTRNEPWVTGMLLAMPGTGISVYPFNNQKVGDLLFNGFYDPLLATIRKFAEGDVVIESDNFSMMKKSVVIGPTRVKTGASDISKFGQVVGFNNQSVLSNLRKGSSCNLIRGTDGSMFPPNLPTDERFYIYAGDLCRSLFFRFERQVEHHGITTNRFVLDPDTFANTNPEYECFCESKINKCWGAGVFNAGQCRNDSQVIVSLPHFLNTNYNIKNAINGLAPDPEQHQFYLDLEPTSGLPLSVSSNMQINLGVERTPWLEVTDNLPEIILPILWMKDGLNMNATMAAKIKSKVIDGPMLISHTIPLVILGIGAAIGLLGILCSIYYMFRNNKTTVQPLHEKTNIKIAFSH